VPEKPKNNPAKMLIKLLLRAMPVLTTRGAIEDKCDKKFELGFQYGHERALEQAFSLKFTVSEPLDPDQEEELRDYLIGNNLAICYDPMLGGLRLRRYMHPKDHARELIARKIHTQTGVYITKKPHTRVGVGTNFQTGIHPKNHKDHL
jgi:hypothetical protein